MSPLSSKGLSLTEALRRLGMAHEKCAGSPGWAPWMMYRRAIRRADGSVWMHGTAGEVWDALKTEGLIR